MTSRAVVIVGFGALLAVLAAMVLVTHVRGSRIATITESVAYLVRSRPARLVAVLVWAWLGWHFLAR